MMEQVIGQNVMMLGLEWSLIVTIASLTHQILTLSLQRLVHWL